MNEGAIPNPARNPKARLKSFSPEEGASYFRSSDIRLYFILQERSIAVSARLRQAFPKPVKMRCPGWNLPVTTNAGTAHLSIHFALYEFLPGEC
jgi:hypothetical protein